MSLDASYIFYYDNLPYELPPPWVKDEEYLTNKYGGKFESIGINSFFWEKPKHLLLTKELNELYADQVLQRIDCERWEILK